MRKLFIFLFLFLLSLKGISQDWTFVSTDVDGDKWYIKSSYISKRGFENLDNAIRIWTKKELKKKTVKKNGKSLIYANVKELQLIEADCNDKRIKIITTILYNSSGKVIDTRAVAEYEQEWRDTVPESMGEAIIQKICELFN